MINSISSKGLSEYQSVLNTPNPAGNSSAPKSLQKSSPGSGKRLSRR